MSGNIVINALFTEFQRHMDADQELREVIRNICKDVGQISREATTILQVIHHDEDAPIIACSKARKLFDQAREGYAKLKEALPPTDYYKYQEHWRTMTQRFCFMIALTIWLESGTLATHKTVADVLGINVVEKDGFHLDIDDYLNGLLQMCSELARLAVNAVTQGDYEKPMQISKFVMELNAGFRLLNLKNDHLRKRFDVLKYDVKKIEEVVYDISIRGLRPSGEAPEANAAPEAAEANAAPEAAEANAAPEAAKANAAPEAATGDAAA